MTVEPDRKGESISSLGAKVGDCLSVMPEIGLGRDFPVVRFDSFVEFKSGVGSLVNSEGERVIRVCTVSGVTPGPQGSTEVRTFVSADARLFREIAISDLFPTERLSPGEVCSISGNRGIR